MNTTQAITDIPIRRKAGNTVKVKRQRIRRDSASKAILKPDTLGQVFTPASLVTSMLALRKNKGRIMEPSCGSGAFSNQLHDAGEILVALELDGEHAPPYASVIDFFDYPVSQKFNTVLGNPPYLRYQDIPADTKKKLDMTRFDGRTNLYLFFIEKCIKHLAPGGELIFVVPRDFPQATAARKLNRWLFEQGTITHFWETGDRTFIGASPSCCVFRYEKGRMNRQMSDDRIFTENNGRLHFLPAGHAGTSLSTLFDVAVGGITGADNLYARDDGKLDVVCAQTVKTGKTRKMLDDTQAKMLLAGKKDILIRRGVRKFSEENWWSWGRSWKKSAAPRIYVNTHTRTTNPFFTHTSTVYDGSVLALFPKIAGIDVAKVAAILNDVDWGSLGFMDGERFIFKPRPLSSCLLPAGVVQQIKQAISASKPNPDKHGKECA